MNTRTKKWAVLIAALALMGGSGLLWGKARQRSASKEETREISPFAGSLQNVISCPATLLPKNRLEVKPPVNGRIDSILVQEGERVTTGQILGWMSSAERAALLDAARGQGEESLKYWEDAIKPIPLPSPMDGEVIVATIQPGQTVTTSDPVVVLSDRLIVQAQVDETDIGKIRPDMQAIVSLDAYPDTKINAVVEHIYYESETVNNVTVYKVDLKPEEVPSFFRSGMNATVDFIAQSRENALLLPVEAVHREGGMTYCLLRQNGSAQPVRVRVTTGLSDDKNVEILSGVTKDDRVLLKMKKYSLPTDNRGKNPFMPHR